MEERLMTARDKETAKFLKAKNDAGFSIIPFVVDGKKQYNVVKNARQDNEEAYNPILDGEWIECFAKA
jgi:hypothetical protein